MVNASFPLDGSEIQYLIATLVNLYGAILFSWWWVKSRHASFMFMCITSLFIGEFVDNGITLYGRILRTAGIDLTFSDSTLWAYRGSLSIIASLCVIGYLTLRVTGHIRLPSHFRRKADIDKSTLCRSSVGVLVHKMGGPILYYKCIRCGEEWQAGDVGYVKAKENGDKMI